jgi:uncharacterized protein YjbJ (UPF0337 family)
MMNENLFKGNWNELKGKIRSAWGKLTDDELEKTKGEFKQVEGLIQQKYGMLQEDARNKLNEFFRKHQTSQNQNKDADRRPA